MALMAIQSQRRLVALDIVNQSQRQQQLQQQARSQNALVAQRDIENQRADRRLDYNIGRQDRQDEIAAQNRKREIEAYSQDWIAKRILGFPTDATLPEQSQYTNQAFKDAARAGIDVTGWTHDRFMNAQQRASLLAQVQTPAARLQEDRQAEAASLLKARLEREKTQLTEQRTYTEGQAADERARVAALLKEERAYAADLLADKRGVAAELKQRENAAALAKEGYYTDEAGERQFIIGGKADPAVVKALAAAKAKADAESGGVFEGTGIKNQEFNVLLAYAEKLRRGEPTTPQENQAYALAYEDLTRPRFQTLANGEQIEIPGMNLAAAGYPAPGGSAQPGALAGQPNQPAATPTREPIATKPKSTGTATTLANMEGAQKDLATAKAILFDDLEPDGSFGPRSNISRMNLGLANTPFTEGMPFSEGREAFQSTRRAVEVLLRIRSGAAIPTEEVNLYMDLYFPSNFDTDRGAMAKFRRLDEFFTSTTGWLQGGKKGDAPDPAGVPAPQTLKDFEALPSGTVFIDPDSKSLRRKK